MKDEWAIYQEASNSDEANTKQLQKEAGFAAHRCVCVFSDDDDPTIECGYHEQLRAKLAEAEREVENIKTVEFPKRIEKIRTALTSKLEAAEQRAREAEAKAELAYQRAEWCNKLHDGREQYLAEVTEKFYRAIAEIATAEQRLAEAQSLNGQLTTDLMGCRDGALVRYLRSEIARLREKEPTK